MARSRLGLKVLGLCALALGLMAFVASAAQAEFNAHWNIIKANGELLKIESGSTLLPQLEIKELENNTLTLLFTTKSGTKVAILCTAAKFDEGGKLVANGGISEGRILFTGCSVSLNGAAAPGCQAHSTGKAKGEILTERAVGLIVLDKLENGEVDDFIKIVPAVGTTFAKIEMGEECAIGTLVKIEAKSAGEGLWLKDCGLEPNKSFLEEKVEHLIEGSLQGLIALGVPTTTDGSAIVRLANPGEHGGLKWGGTPG
jgi:hypothetical protein